MPGVDDDVQDELRRIQQRARKKAIRRWVMMVPGMITMLVVWAGATVFVGWLPGAIVGGLAGAAVTIGLEKLFPPPPED